jgi:oligopeptidase A
MVSILHKREAQAKLLGFQNFAEYSLATKMVKDPHEVVKFLRDLLKQVKAKAEEQYTEVKTFAKQKYNLDEIFAWDLRYLNEKLKLQKFDFSEEELRTYFPESQVLTGLFSIVKKLYGIQVKEIDHFQKWHDTVRLFEVLDSNDNKQGMFYLDLYVRPNKRHGAWCGDCRARHYDSKKGDNPDINHHKIKHPVAYVVANFGNPMPGQEAQYTHDEVITLFHEFGHCLHHILTKVDYPSISGTQGVEWDAVELPSQFLENWCYEKQSLDMVSKHRTTGKPLPDELFNKVKAAENFQGGLALVRQLEFALFDMLLHSEPDVEDVQMVLDNVRKEVSVIPVPSFNRFQNSFSHIFAGGYAAGYYSYLWSEMLSADAFSLFKEQGIFNRATGENFLKNILEMGGSKDAMTLFKNFRGRAPEIAALLKQRELIS